MYETYYDKLQPYLGQENLKLQYMDCDSFVLSIELQNIFNDLEKLEDLFDFSNSNENHELFSNQNKKAVGKFKIETPENNWIDEFVALRSERYALKCGDNSKSKLKGISKSYSKNIEFEELKNCLDSEKNKKSVIIMF